MTDPRIRAAFYLSPTVDALWRWSDDGLVLTWPDNATIAFAPEVQTVLARLAPGGLPPFGAVALLLGACRQGWIGSGGREAILQFSRLDAASANDPPAVYFADLRIRTSIDQLVAGLDRLGALMPTDPADVRAAKPLLAEIVFEGSTGRGTSADAALVLEGIDLGITGDMLRPQLSHEDRLAQFARQVEGMADGLARVNADVLVRRGRTGLDEEVAPAEEDLSPPDAVRQLLAELRNDNELAGLAKLAQNLMAAVTVPRTLHRREELAVGGVSDLTNRGSLDRLLVSELAHDDLTLAVRVAVNEALYLRRETPPAEPPHRRAILIDAGVRMWGIPRVFAAAVALALAATNDPAATLDIYRAAGAGAEPVDLTTRGGLDAHLAALESAAHPGASIPAFFAAIEQAAAATDGQAGHTDAVLVTHADVLGDPDFITALASANVPPIYVAALDRAGGFSLLVLSKAGRKPVREAKLALEEILATKPPKTPSASPLPLVNKQIDMAMPAILYLDEFPFRLPHVIDPSRAAVSAVHGMVGATHDGRFLHWTGDNVGARQLTSLLPGGHVQCVFINDAQEIAGVLITRRRRPVASLVVAALRTGRCTQAELTGCEGVAAGAFVRQGLMYIVYPDRVDAHAFTGGAPVASLALGAGATWRRDRFFRTTDSHWTIAYDGSETLKFERITHRAADVIALIDVEGFESPWAIASHFAYEPAGRLAVRFIETPIGRVIGTSRDGRLVAFESRAESYVMDLTKEAVAKSANPREELMAPEIYWSTRSSVHPRNRFKTIFVDSESRLALATKSGDVFAFDKSNADWFVMMEQGRDTKMARLMQTFNEIRRRPGMLFKLSIATWNDGSKAFLDARGILHLKSSDRSVPEISITLSNVLPAAWSSEGKVTGPDYFVNCQNADGPNLWREESAYFLKKISDFIARLR